MKRSSILGAAALGIASIGVTRARAAGGAKTVNAGIHGVSDSGDGVVGISNSGHGVLGISSTYTGVKGKSFEGIGIGGETKSQDSPAVAGYGKRAAFFQGNVGVNGIFSVHGFKQFQIDHPLDPANKYLSHASVESSDVMNIYNGNVVLDGNGEAVVQLPDWFQALNNEFRYQLTPIDTPGPNLHIAGKVADNRFKIGGGRPRTEVSWQITGIRRDAWAKAHPMHVEQEKPVKERGAFLHPEMFGQPEEKSMARVHLGDFMREPRERG